MVDIDEMRARAHKNDVSWADVIALCDEINRLRDVCAEAYQLAGVAGAPVEALDNLSAAANGEPLPHETFLPVFWADVSALIAEHNLDVHHHVSKGKVSVWHGEQLTRVTATLDEHGGALPALEWAVNRCLENLSHD